MKYNGKFLTDSFQIDYHTLSYEKYTCLILTFVRKSDDINKFSLKAVFLLKSWFILLNEGICH